MGMRKFLRVVLCSCFALVLGSCHGTGVAPAVDWGYMELKNLFLRTEGREELAVVDEPRPCRSFAGHVVGIGGCHLQVISVKYGNEVILGVIKNSEADGLKTDSKIKGHLVFVSDGVALKSEPYLP
jgi:hypothetical protein